MPSAACHPECNQLPSTEDFQIRRICIFYADVLLIDKGVASPKPAIRKPDVCTGRRDGRTGIAYAKGETVELLEVAEKVRATFGHARCQFHI